KSYRETGARKGNIPKSTNHQLP
ncbi:MAG: hypothetical protein RLZZ417_2253, partial [Bacteroidota bacterium]